MCSAISGVRLPKTNASYCFFILWDANNIPTCLAPLFIEFSVYFFVFPIHNIPEVAKLFSNRKIP